LRDIDLLSIGNTWGTCEREKRAERVEKRLRGRRRGALAKVVRGGKKKGTAGKRCAERREEVELISPSQALMG
jgi:hypothetical protein